MTGGRTRPTHDALDIETLVSTTSTVDLTPKLTIEQRAIAVLCHDILSIAEVSALAAVDTGDGPEIQVKVYGLFSDVKVTDQPK